MSNNAYNYQDLRKAYISAKRYQNAAAELRDYYASLYSCLSFFGVDLREIEQSVNLNTQYSGLDLLFKEALARYLEISSPFSGFLEAPKHICDLYDTYGSKLAGIKDSFKAACFDLMCEIYRIIFGATDKQTTSDELMKFGFDDNEEPDELDFL